MRPASLFALVLLAAVGSQGATAQPPADPRAADLQKWTVHDATRPLPPVVDPGPAGAPAPVPSDAIVLFEGSDLSGWTNAKGGPAGWTVRDGYMEVVKGTGGIRTARSFGSGQLHIE